MKDSYSMICVSRILYPFMFLFGFYIIIFGDLSPGGGFQGGVILATARLISMYIPEKKDINTNYLSLIEKILFLLLIILGIISFFTNEAMFSNIISNEFSHDIRRWFLVLLNIIIGIKVSSGLTLIFMQFVEEGN